MYLFTYGEPVHVIKKLFVQFLGKDPEKHRYPDVEEELEKELRAVGICSWQLLDGSDAARLCRTLRELDSRKLDIFDAQQIADKLGFQNGDIGVATILRTRDVIAFRRSLIIPRFDENRAYPLRLRIA